MAAAPLHRKDAAARQGEGAPSRGGYVPAAGASPVLVDLGLEAVVGVLEGVPVAGPGLVGLQAGQALQGGATGSADAGRGGGLKEQEYSLLTSHPLSPPPPPPFPFHRREIRKPITMRQRTSRAAMTRPSSAMSPGR